MDAFLVSLSTLGPGMSIVYTICLVVTERIVKDSSKHTRKFMPTRKASQSTLALKACFVQFGNQRRAFFHLPYENFHAGLPFLCTVLMKLLDVMHSRNSKILHTLKQK